MGRLEDLISTHAANARHDLGKALTAVCSIDDEAMLGDSDLGRIADYYHRMTWWQQVTDLTHGREETVDGGTAILTVRQRAQHYLVNTRERGYSSAFAVAMAESRRDAAQTFLEATRQLAEALTPPPARTPRPAGPPSVGPAPAEATPSVVAMDYRP
jgi:hypothetical protein